MHLNGHALIILRYQQYESVVLTFRCRGAGASDDVLVIMNVYYAISIKSCLDIAFRYIIAYDSRHAERIDDTVVNASLSIHISYLDYFSGIKAYRL